MWWIEQAASLVQSGITADTLVQYFGCRKERQKPFLVAGICLISYLVVLWAETEGIPPLLLSGISIGVQFLMNCIWLRGKTGEKLILCILIDLTILLASLFSFRLFELLFRIRAVEANAGTDSWELRILFLLLGNFLFFLCTRLILRGRRKGRLNRSEVVLLLAMTALTLICGGIAYQDIMEKRGTYLHGLFIIGMIIFTVTLYVFFMRMHLFREKEMEAERFRIQVQEQSVLIDQVRKQYEETVKLRHDLKHYVFQMEDLLERGQVEELSVYLGNFLDQKVGRIRQYLESGSAIVDAVINTKLSQAAERGIEVQTAVSGRMEEGEEDRELGIILANLLDNAAEACQKQEVSWIFLRAELNRNQWYFSIENSILPEMELSFLTTKKEPGYHGYGLKSAKSLTEKMGGILQMRRKEESFQVKVMISREI